MTGVSLRLRRIVDADLGYLQGLPKLREVNLYDTSISDAGLGHLKGHEPERKLVDGQKLLVG